MTHSFHPLNSMTHSLYTLESHDTVPLPLKFHNTLPLPNVCFKKVLCSSPLITPALNFGQQLMSWLPRPLYVLTSLAAVVKDVLLSKSILLSCKLFPRPISPLTTWHNVGYSLCPAEKNLLQNGIRLETKKYETEIWHVVQIRMIDEDHY
jgi:hypothetical protein